MMGRPGPCACPYTRICVRERPCARVHVCSYVCVCSQRCTCVRVVRVRVEACGHVHACALPTGSAEIRGPGVAALAQYPHQVPQESAARQLCPGGARTGTPGHGRLEAAPLAVTQPVVFQSINNTLDPAPPPAGDNPGGGSGSLLPRGPSRGEQGQNGDRRGQRSFNLHQVSQNKTFPHLRARHA